MSQPFTTTVIDAGGRYGKHPTWKPFRGDLAYHMFEPDTLEADRLRQKYAARAGEVTVVDQALASEEGTLVINFFANRAMSGSATRQPISALFHGERLPEVAITERVEVPTTTIDLYCQRHGLAADFLKLDTEGTEYEILQGARSQLDTSVLGVRSEVAFDEVFAGKPLFGAINDLLLSQGYFLLNLDYDGRGDYQNDFADARGRYGILTACDGVWLRRFPWVFSGQRQEVLGRVLKLAAFCLLNNAGDVAIEILLKARNEAGLDLSAAASSSLYRFVDIGVQKLLYSLKWQPGQSLERNYKVYFDIFGKEAKRVHEFMQSDILNPD